MTRSVPYRTCVGCRRKAPAPELVRVRRAVTGLELGAGPGRGAWLCRSHPTACLDRLGHGERLARALRTSISSDDLRRVRATLEVHES